MSIIIIIMFYDKFFPVKLNRGVLTVANNSELL